MFHVTMKQARSSSSSTTAVFQTHRFRYALLLLLLAFAALQPSWSFSIRGQDGPLRPDTDIDRRQLLHQIVLFTATPLAAAITATTSAVALLPEHAAAAPLIPERTKATATFAKDKFGSVLVATQYLASKPARDRSLVFGLKDEPTYLIVNDDKSALERFALNAECSHLGCIVPWNEFEKKFECPCHGSKYDAVGNVLRGPAPYALALAHVDTDEESGKIVLSPWTETDFRTNEAPWWK